MSSSATRRRAAAPAGAHDAEGAPLARSGATRRRFLAGVGAGGAAVAGLALLPRLAQAGEELTETDLAAFLASAELAAVDVFDAAVDSGMLSGPNLATAGRIRDQHQAHADALAPFSDGSPSANQTLVDELGPQAEDATDELTLLGLLVSLEDSLVSTHLTAVDEVSDVELAATISQVLPVDSQHAVVLGIAGELSPAEVLPALETKGEALDPALYPIG